MRVWFINRSWQQLCLVMILCAACLIACIDAMRIFPVYGDQIDYTTKRQFTTSRYCNLCFMHFDSVSCIRCKSGTRYIVPYYTTKRTNIIVKPRSNENSMCSCCAFTRMSNQYCCNACSASQEYK